MDKKKKQVDKKLDYETMFKKMAREMRKNYIAVVLDNCQASMRLPGIGAYTIVIAYDLSWRVKFMELLDHLSYIAEFTGATGLAIRRRDKPASYRVSINFAKEYFRRADIPKSEYRAAMGHPALDKRRDQCPESSLSRRKNG